MGKIYRDCGETSRGLHAHGRGCRDPARRGAVHHEPLPLTFCKQEEGGFVADRRRGGCVTQLIAAICEGGRKVIALSDRMVSTSDFTLVFEHDVPKGKIISSNALVLTAGTVHEPEIIENVRDKLKGIHNPKIRKIAEELSNEYSEVRLRRIESEILNKHGFQSLKEFRSEQRMLEQDTVMRIQSEIEHYDLGVHILVVGVDSEAHIYYVYNPGTCRSWDSLGFCCIGQGDRHAEPTFAFYNYTPSLSEKEVLYITFEAKKRSEMAGGIGRTTDIWIIDEKGIWEVEEETVKRLEEIFESRNESSRMGDLEGRISDMEVKRRKVEIE